MGTTIPGWEVLGGPTGRTLRVQDVATGAPLLLEVTLDGVRPTKVLHLVERRTVGGVEQLVPLAEGFLPFSEDDPRVRVLGAVVTDGDARRELPTAPARCKKGT